MKKEKNIVHIDKDVIEKRVKEILADRFNIDVEEVNDSSTLDELGIDSFEGLLILVAFEQKFNFTIKRDESSQLKTFGDLLQLVKKCLKDNKE